jgi:hypothetical protein
VDDNWAAALVAVVLGGTKGLEQFVHQRAKGCALLVVQLTEASFDVRKHLTCFEERTAGKLDVSSLKFFAGIVDEAERYVNVGLDKVRANAIQRTMVV